MYSVLISNRFSYIIPSIILLFTWRVPNTAFLSVKRPCTISYLYTCHSLVLLYILLFQQCVLLFLGDFWIVPGRFCESFYCFLQSMLLCLCFSVFLLTFFPSHYVSISSSLCHTSFSLSCVSVLTSFHNNHSFQASFSIIIFFEHIFCLSKYRFSVTSFKTFFNYLSVTSFSYIFHHIFKCTPGIYLVFRVYVILLFCVLHHSLSMLTSWLTFPNASSLISTVSLRIILY